MHGEEDDELIFLYSLKEGYVEYSYAAHVAKSVGIQANIVDRANEVNITLEVNQAPLDTVRHWHKWSRNKTSKLFK